MKRSITGWFFSFLTLTLASIGASASSLPEARLEKDFPFRGIPAPEVFVQSTGKDQGPTIGLYAGNGTWSTGKEHLKLFFQKYGYNYVSVSSDDIISGRLLTSGINALAMPGGESWTYLADLGDKGAQNIKTFVAQGNGYFGVCAGAFYATSLREGGKATGPYGIGLLDGTAYDGTSLQTPPFKEGMLDFDFFISGFAALYRIVLLGGPSFHYSDQEARAKHIEVWARFQQIHEPAMISFQYRKGRVFLSGPHLEIEENLTNWGQDYYDPDSEWPILNKVMGYLAGLDHQ